MLKKRTIAKIQLIFGIILLSIAIFLSVFIVKEFYLDRLVRGISGVTSEWSEVQQQINGTEIGIDGLITSNVVLQAQVMGGTGIVFMTCGLVLVVLSLMFILQGLYNLSKK